MCVCVCACAFVDPRLTGSFSKLLVKSSDVMFMLRSGGAVPLRTTDGGASWQDLPSSNNGLARLFQYGATFDGSLSWSGKTLVLTGNDPTAIGLSGAS